MVLKVFSSPNDSVIPPSGAGHWASGGAGQGCPGDKPARRRLGAELSPRKGPEQPPLRCRPPPPLAVTRGRPRTGRGLRSAARLGRPRGCQPPARARLRFPGPSAGSASIITKKGITRANRKEKAWHGEAEQAGFNFAPPVLCWCVSTRKIWW